jgi:hypothetical protein
MNNVPQSDGNSLTSNQIMTNQTRHSKSFWHFKRCYSVSHITTQFINLVEWELVKGRLVRIIGEQQ